MRRQIEQAMTAHDLTAAQWYPLWKLKRDGPGTAQELARDMDIDAGAMTRLIDRLAAKGLVERLRSATDRRVVMLTLTPAGEAVAAHSAAGAGRGQQRLPARLQPRRVAAAEAAAAAHAATAAAAAPWRSRPMSDAA